MHHAPIGRAVIAGALAAVLGSPLAGCGKNPMSFGGPPETPAPPPDPTATLLATNPAMICASPETMAGVKALVFQNLDASQINSAANPAYKTQLLAGVVVTNAVSRLEQYRADIKRVSCSAKLTFTWPPALVARLKTQRPTPDWAKDIVDATYSIQPQADGKGYVYTLDQASAHSVTDSVTGMINTLAEADAPQSPPFHADDSTTPSPPRPAARDDAGDASGDSQSLSGSRH